MISWQPHGHNGWPGVAAGMTLDRASTLLWSFRWMDCKLFPRWCQNRKVATEEGTVILVGRSLDGEGPAVVVFEAVTETEARRFMEGDPFISSGPMHGHLHPFRAALVRGS